MYLWNEILCGIIVILVLVLVYTVNQLSHKKEIQWKPIKKLGEGGFGTVWLAEDTTNGFQFAVKKVNRVRDIQMKALRDEMKILKTLDHKNIVKFYDWQEDRNCGYMLMELMEGSVKDEMKRTESPIPNKKAVKYTRDILQGLIYLHSKHVVHRDIKCANVLVDKEVAKLADMGISKYHYDMTNLHVKKMYRCGSPLWMSPEVIDRRSAGRRSDVWSVGCTVYEMVTGEPPFAYLTDENELEEKIMNLEHCDLVKGERFRSKLESFFLDIFVEVEIRPYADDIADHAWLKMSYEIASDQYSQLSSFTLPCFSLVDTRFVSAFLMYYSR